jgi:hypothetical protein
MQEQKKVLITLFALILVAVIIFPTKGVTITGAAAYYLNNGLSAYKNIPMDIPARPIFLGFITLSFHIFGVSVESAYWVTRFFFVLNILMTYIIAVNFYGFKVGLFASLLVVFSYAINLVGIFLNVDPVVTFFFPFIGLPFLLFCFVREYRIPRNGGRLLWFCVSFALSLIPALIYSSSHGGDSLIIGDLAPWAVEKFSGQSPLQLIYNQLVLDLFRNMYKYLTLYIFPNFVLWFFILLAWIFVIIRSVRRKQAADMVLLISAILFSPAVIIQGYIGERLGQGMPLFYLSYIVMASFICSASHFVSVALHRFLKSRINISRIELVSFLFVIITFISIELFNKGSSSFRIFFDKQGAPSVTALSFYRGQFTVAGHMDDDLKASCNWINQNVPKGETVYVDGGIWEAFDFFTNLDYQKEHFPRCIVSFNVAGVNPTDIPLTDGRPVCIFPALGFTRHVERYRNINLIFERDLYKILRAIRNHYMIISKRNNFLGYYLEKLGAFPVYSSSQVKIYRGSANITKTDNDLKLITSDSFMEAIPWLKKQYSAEKQYSADYERLEHFLSKFGLGSDTLTGNTYEKYQQDWVRKHIPRESAIAFSFHTGKFIIEEDYKTSWFNQDRPLSSFEHRYDFLFIHNTRRRSNEFPVLFQDLEEKKPMMRFPHMIYLGDGWEIYRLERE